MNLIWTSFIAFLLLCLQESAGQGFNHALDANGATCTTSFGDCTPAIDGIVHQLQTNKWEIFSAPLGQWIHIMFSTTVILTRVVIKHPYYAIERNCKQIRLTFTGGSKTVDLTHGVDGLNVMDTIDIIPVITSAVTITCIEVYDANQVYTGIEEIEAYSSIEGTTSATRTPHVPTITTNEPSTTTTITKRSTTTTTKPRTTTATIEPSTTTTATQVPTTTTQTQPPMTSTTAITTTTIPSGRPPDIDRRTGGLTQTETILTVLLVIALIVIAIVLLCWWYKRRTNAAGRENQSHHTGITVTFSNTPPNLLPVYVNQVTTSTQEQQQEQQQQEPDNVYDQINDCDVNDIKLKDTTVPPQYENVNDKLKDATVPPQYENVKNDHVTS